MVVGVGLIGGSVALALRRLGWYVVGVDNRRDQRSARHWLPEWLMKWAMIGPCDLAVIATPVDTIPDLAQAALDAGAAVVTDVGSVKAPNSRSGD